MNTPVTLTVSAHVNSGVLTYQWYINRTGWGGTWEAVGSPSSNPNLTLDTTAVATTYYHCVVTNTDATATGNKTATTLGRDAQIVVRHDAQAPILDIYSPYDTSVIQNSVATLTVSAYIDAGDSLTYQWYSNTTNSNTGGTPIGSSSSSPSLTLPTSTAGTQYYYCVVTNTDSGAPGLTTASVTSRAASVEVSAFSKGMVLFTFDDGWYDTYSQAYPILNGKGFKGTVYINTDAVDQSGFLSLNQMKALYSANWDVGNHTSTHDDIGNLTDEANLERLKTIYTDDATWLTANGMPRGAYHAAYPSGLYSLDLIKVLQNLGFKTGRATGYGLQLGIHYKNDFFRLPVYSLTTQDDLTACLDGVDRVANGGSTIIFMIHKVEPIAGDLVTTTAQLQSLVDYVKTKVDAGRVNVMTISQWYGVQNPTPSGTTPPAPTVTNDDVANTVSGLNFVMEYKLDGAATYTAYTPATFNLNLTGDHTLAVRYAASGVDPAGPDTILTFTKTLQSISITTPPRTNYVEGTTFDTTGMVVTAHYDDGTSADVTGYTFSPNVALTTGDTKVTISYTSGIFTKTVDQVITVSAKALTGITIDTPPTKITYIEGNLFDPTDMVVTAHFDNGTTAVATGYTFSPNAALATTDTGVTVSYTYAGKTKTVDQPITVRLKALTGITIDTPPAKVSYIEGIQFDPTGMVVTAHYDNGTSATVDMSSYVFMPAVPLATTDTEVTIYYNEGGIVKTADQAVTVRAKALTSIAITAPPSKTEYTEGDAFNSTGMVVRAYFDNGSSTQVLGYTINPSGALAVTDSKVTVSYTTAGVTRTADQEITVHAKSLVRIAITQAPTNVNYVEGNLFNPAGMVVTAYYDNDVTAIITGYSFEPTGALTTANRKVTIKYGGMTADQPITVRAKALESIEVTAPPSKTVYIEGNTFNPAGMEITAYFDNATSMVVTDYTLDPAADAPLAVTDTQVAISYTYGGVEKLTHQTIKVNPTKLTSITIDAPPTKVNYIEGNLFDPTGMVVTAHYDNGTSAAATGYTFSPSAALTTAAAKITVSYTYAGVTKTVDQAISVRAKALTGITIDTPPTQVSYIAGNLFNPTGMVVTAHFDNGTSAAATGYTLSPNTALATTDTKVTVSYTYAGVTKAVDQTITVRAKALTGITIDTPPTKVDYIEGIGFDPTGMVVTAHYDNGTSAVVDKTNYTFMPALPLATTDTEVSIYYNEGGVVKTADQAITVRAMVLTGVTIDTPPTKVNYIEGNLFDPTGMVVTAHYDNGTSAAATGYTFSPSAALTTAAAKITVSYTYAGVTKTVDQAISVRAKALTGITIDTPPTQVSYIAGNLFNPTGMVVTAHFDNGTSAAATGYTLSPNTALATTDTKVTASYTYAGVTKAVDQTITVRAEALTGITIDAPPTKVDYIEGIRFDPTGMVVTAHFDNGTSAAATGYTLSPNTALATTDTKVTVSYTYAGVTKAADQAITVRAKALTGITIDVPPTQVSYIEGNLFNPTGMVVTAHFDNDTSAAATGYTYPSNTTLATTDTKVTVSYTYAGVAKAADQAITVRAKALTGITVDAPPTQVNYFEGYQFDPTGMVVAAHYDNDTSVPVTDYTFSPSATLATTDTKVTVSYTYAGVTKTVDQAITVQQKGQLKALGLTSGKLSPAFDQNVFNYTLTLSANVDKVTLRPALVDSKSKLYINSKLVSSITAAVKLGQSYSITMKVITAAGKTVNYNVTVVRPKSTDATLASLKKSAGTLTTAFQSTTTSYTVLLAYAQSSTTISARVTDKNSSYTMNLDGKATKSKSISLNPGQTRSFTITVKAQAGNTRVYTVIVTRAKSTNANLASLKMSKGTLKPGFKSTTTSYAVLLPRTQSSTVITTTLADKTSSYTMELDGIATTSKSISLSPGQTRTLVITVQAQAGNTRIYMIKITRPQ